MKKEIKIFLIILSLASSSFGSPTVAEIQKKEQALRKCMATGAMIGTSVAIGSEANWARLINVSKDPRWVVLILGSIALITWREQLMNAMEEIPICRALGYALKQEAKSDSSSAKISTPEAPWENGFLAGAAEILDHRVPRERRAFDEACDSKDPQKIRRADQALKRAAKERKVGALAENYIQIKLRRLIRRGS